MSFTQTSKTLASCQITDGTLVSFFNDTPYQAGPINWYNQSNQIKYTMVLSENDISQGHRMLLWSRYFLRGSIDTIPRVVPFLLGDVLGDFDNVENEDISESGVPSPSSIFGDSGSDMSIDIVYPLYEAMIPALSELKDSSNTNVVFWTNLKPGAVQDDNAYRADNIFRVSSYDYRAAVNAGITRKALCSATISFEMLKQSGGGLTDIHFVHIPVITNVKILSFSDGAIFDFSGGGGGIGIHSHESNSNSAGGFAYSVFAPGSSVKPISWV